MRILMMALGLLGAAYGLWFVVIALLGSVKKYSPPAPGEPKARFAVLVPARNEENVVGHLVNSLIRQDYPRELFDVVVIPNNCADNTAEAAQAAGAEILACDAPVKSKGDVLRFAFNVLRGRGYDAYCIMDADNLAAPGFLRAANNGVQAGLDIAQGFRDSKNPADSWVAGATSMFFWIMNRFYYRARVALGMSAALNGTGIVITSRLVDELGWNMVSLTEDLEFTGLCASRGVRIGYLQDAVVYDEQPIGLWDSIVQRRRWFKGGMQCFSLYASPLLRRHSLHALDMLCVFSGWIMMILGMLSGVLTALNLLGQLLDGSLAVETMALSGAGIAGAIYLICVLAAFALCALEKKLKKVGVSAILLFPVFLITWGLANFWAMVTPAPKWQQIAHVRGTDTPD